MASEGTTSARPGWSVRVRILASILVTAALGLVVAGLVSYGLQRGATLREVDARLTTELTEARRVVGAQSGVTSTRTALRQVLSVAVPPEDGGTVGLLDGRVAFTPGVTEPVHPEKLAGFATRIARRPPTARCARARSRPVTAPTATSPCRSRSPATRRAASSPSRSTWGGGSNRSTARSGRTRSSPGSSSW
ncbi:hypothetical protein [Pseudolysinimonas kribbensis]|uniref:hypothetical protein n=1 Tax=Pseudolysinimonas kribbensis TaxID=433641 RepID=UPI0024E16F6D|nr:hypothetical protein [Pseudolysinimonas kribbensis]